MEATLNLALLGQPNSGKSTLFNGLTGARQHVGNWPGKTVEKKTGEFTANGTSYTVCDLPGAYSLSAMSEEERVTRDYIESGNVDVVCLMVDASQLSRSLYMLADFAGADVPCVLVLNMMDVARDQGRQINADLLQQRLGVPVVPFVANEKAGYNTLTDAVDKAAAEHLVVDDSQIAQLYAQYSPEWQEAFDATPAADGKFGRAWLAASKAGESQSGAVNCASARFAWVDALLDGVQVQTEMRSKFLDKLDSALLSARWGKLASALVLLLGFGASMVCALPIMVAGMGVQALAGPLGAALTSVGVSGFVADLVVGMITVLYFSISMAGFVFGVTFVFGVLEEIGIVSRVSYAFDNTMAKLGLQGKVVMPFMMSLGCTMAGVAGSRVVDTWGQRILTIALAWAVPCGATFAVIPTLGIAFFGFGGMLCVMLLIFALMVLVMVIVAKVFGGKLNPVEGRTGLVMEMPPYHKPKVKQLLVMALRRAWNIFKRAIRVVFLVAFVFWLLSYSPSGEASGSVLYGFGQAIEPFTRLFGLGWQTFLAFVSSMISKEAVLGVLAVLYSGVDANLWSATTGDVSQFLALDSLVQQVPAAEALAFMIAVTFNVPCLMALSTTYSETHSLKWTLIVGLFYICMALVLCGIVYHIAVLVM